MKSFTFGYRQAIHRQDSVEDTLVQEKKSAGELATYRIMCEEVSNRCLEEKIRRGKPIVSILSATLKAKGKKARNGQERS